MKQCEMGRIPQMKEAIGEKADLFIGRHLEKLSKSLTSNRDTIWRDLESALEKLASDKKEGSLVISFLRSSYITNNQEFYIAYYEEEPFVEEEPDCIYFDMKRAFGGIEEDWHEIDEVLHQKFIRVFAGEKEEIHRWYMERIYIALENIMKTAVEKMHKSGAITVYYGGYMEEIKAIGSI